MIEIPNALRGRWLLLACAGLLIAGLYLPFLGNALVNDDHAIFSRTLEFADQPFDLHPRTFPIFTLAFVQVIVGSIPAQRIVSLAIHAANAGMLYGVILALLSARSDRSPPQIQLASLLGALLFGLHPVATYGAGYLAQRTILLATFFTLAALQHYIQYLESGSVRNLTWASLATIAAMFCKEHAALAPLAIALVTPVVLREGRVMARRVVPYLLVTLACSLYVTVLLKSLLTSAYEPFVSNISLPATGRDLWWISISTQCGLFFEYLRAWFLPDLARFAIEIPIPLLGEVDYGEVTAFSLFGLAAGLLLVSGGQLALIGFGFLYAWIQFGVEFSTVRAQETFVLYRSYLWAPGFAIVAATCLLHIPRRWMLIFTGCAIMALLFVQSRDRLESMRNELTVWTDARQKLRVATYAGNFRVHAPLAVALLQSGDVTAALAEAETGLRASPGTPELNYARALALKSLGRYEEALDADELAISAWPRQDFLHAGMILTKIFLLRSLHRDREVEKYLVPGATPGSWRISLEVRDQ